MGRVGRFFKGVAGFFKKDPSLPFISNISGMLGAIGELHTSGEEKSRMRQGVIDTWINAQASVLTTELSHGPWLARSWRPIVMLSFAAILVYDFFIGPMAGWATVPIPDELWFLLQLGIGGYIGGRSLEKMATIIAPGRKLKKLIEKLDEKS